MNWKPNPNSSQYQLWCYQLHTKRRAAELLCTHCCSERPLQAAAWVPDCVLYALRLQGRLVTIPSGYTATGGTSYNVNQFYGPSAWDVPNRVSLGWSYDVPGVPKSGAFVHKLTTGFDLGSTAILQSGHPDLCEQPEPSGSRRYHWRGGYSGQLPERIGGRELRLRC